MDEITEPRASRPLPAPTGPRSPTGPVPLTIPAHAIPPPVDAVPVLPYLPAVVPKVSNPITSQVATLLGTTLHAPGPQQPIVDPPKRKRRLLIALAIVVAVAAMLAVVFRNTAMPPFAGATTEISGEP
jgi:hypothetical protein